MEKYIEKADILLEALPYIQRFANKTIVIKYGGHAMEDEELKISFVRDVILLHFIGLNPVIVHGGGPQIDGMLDKIGKKSQFIEGMRVTDEETMEVVEMVLVGKINKEIVSRINSNGGHAIGLSGADGNLIRARKMWAFKKGQEGQEKERIDLGMVGEVESIDPEVIRTFMANKWIPGHCSGGGGTRGRGLQHQRRPGGGKGGLLAGGGEVHSSHRCGRSSGRPEAPDLHHGRQDRRPVHSGRDHQRRNDSQGEMLPGGPAGGGQEDPHHRRPGEACHPPGDFYRRGDRNADLLRVER